MRFRWLVSSLQMIILMFTAINLGNFYRIDTGRAGGRSDETHHDADHSSVSATVKTKYAAKKSDDIISCRVMKTAVEYRRCRNEQLRKRGVKVLSPHLNMDTSCLSDSVNTWEDVQRCFNGPASRKRHHPARSTFSQSLNKGERHLHLIGERNSGTKWVVDEIKNCFPSDTYNIKIHRDYLRPKHFFQPTDSTTRNFNLHNHYVISIFRSPIEWVAAMIEKPYHSPNHVQQFDTSTNQPIPLTWQEFVNRPWTLHIINRTNHDWKEYSSDPQVTEEASKCKYGFASHEVVPCWWTATNTTIPPSLRRAYEPVYELRRDKIMDKRYQIGVPFDNILQLRAEKIKNFLIEIPQTHKLGGYLAVRYEDLVMNGTRTMLEQVAEIIGLPDGLPQSCKPTLPSPNRLGRRKIPDGLRQWVEDNLLLETERLLGYGLPLFYEQAGQSNAYSWTRESGFYT